MGREHTLLLIGHSSGKRSHTYLGNHIAGPFESEQEFNEYLNRTCLVGRFPIRKCI